MSHFFHTETCLLLTLKEMSPMAKYYLGKIKMSKETVLNETLASQLPGGLVSPSDIWKKLPHPISLHSPFDISTYTVDGQYCYKLVLSTRMVISEPK